MDSLNSIVVSGYYGFDNSGDDAILKAIVKDFRECDPKIAITVLSNDPEKTKDMYAVEVVHRFKFKDVFKAIKNTDLFISGGGSLLQDITSTRSLLYYLALIKFAKLYRKPVMIYANGIGPINKKINRYLTKKALNNVDLITVRDNNSMEFINDLGVKNDNITVTADPVFTLESAPMDRIREIFKEEKIPDDGEYIGVSIRRWNNSENLTTIISKVIKTIINKYEVNILLIPMHYPEDLGISKEVKDMVNDERCHIISGKYNVEEIMGIIKELEIIIAMRLHSLIYAATQEIPMVGLSYDPKVDGILRSLNMDYICNVESLDYEELLKKVDYVWTNRFDLKSELKRQDEELKEKALSNVRMALDLLKG